MGNLDLNFEGGINMVMGIMIKILMILITVVSLIVVRQTSLMNKVVDVPVGGNFRLVAWLFFWACLILTGIVVLVG